MLDFAKTSIPSVVLAFLAGLGVGWLYWGKIRAGRRVGVNPVSRVGASDVLPRVQARALPPAEDGGEGGAATDPAAATDEGADRRSEGQPLAEQHDQHDDRHDDRAGEDGGWTLGTVERQPTPQPWAGAAAGHAVLPELEPDGYLPVPWQHPVPGAYAQPERDSWLEPPDGPGPDHEPDQNDQSAHPDHNDPQDCDDWLGDGSWPAAPDLRPSALPVDWPSAGEPDPDPAALRRLQQVEGIGAKSALALYRAGLRSVDDVAAADPEQLRNALRADHLRAAASLASWPQRAAALRDGVPAPAPRAAVADPLLQVEGIGPRVADALRAAGVTHLQDLARCDEATLRLALRGARLRAVPGMGAWPARARQLAADAAPDLDGVDQDGEPDGRGALRELTTGGRGL